MKNIKEISIIVALCIGILLSDFSDVVGILGFVGLIAGFINVYFTTKRSELFIIPDIIWIVCSLISLLLTKNYTDMLLYVFYIYIGFVQYFNWKNNKVENKVQIDYSNKSIYWIISFTMLAIFYMLGRFSGSNNILLGAIVSSFGIMGAYLLSQRKYISEYVFTISNIANIFLLFISGLYQLALIPLIFLWFNFLFLYENRPSKNSSMYKEEEFS